VTREQETTVQPREDGHKVAVIAQSNGLSRLII